MDDIKKIKQQTSIKKFCEEHLETKGKTFVCPFCNSGNGKNGTPAFKLYEDTKTFCCHSCNKTGDIFNLCGKVINSNDFKEQIEYIKNWANIHSVEKIVPNKIKTKQKPTNYSEFYNRCVNNIKLSNQYSYLKERGISQETQNLFEVGYCSNWKPPKNPNAPETERIIIPRTKNSYLARAISDKVEKQYQRQVTGTQELFGKDKLIHNEVFIVEGEIDLMSIRETSHSGIALGSTSNKNLSTNITL